LELDWSKIDQKVDHEKIIEKYDQGGFHATADLPFNSHAVDSRVSTEQMFCKNPEFCLDTLREAHKIVKNCIIILKVRDDENVWTKTLRRKATLKGNIFDTDFPSRTKIKIQNFRAFQNFVTFSTLPY